MNEDERSLTSIDIGCGAGELLFHLADEINVVEGVDYSNSMLDQAKERLKNKPVLLSVQNIFEYLPDSKLSSWLTTGAVNQYLTPDEMNQFLDIFEKNPSSRSLFMYDCVDPVRHLMMPYGLSYQRPSGRPGGLLSLVRWGRRAVVAAELATGQLGGNVRKLRGAGMGFGFLPKYWMDAAASRGLSIELSSSRFYEYRYHVILRKQPV